MIKDWTELETYYPEGVVPGLESKPDTCAWNPIETAPRDGRNVVVWLGGIHYTERAAQDRVAVLYWDTQHSIFGRGGCWTNGVCTLGDDIDVTHWMPLPISTQTNDED